MDRKWWTLMAVCLGVFMLLLDITIVNVALPDIARSFGSTLSDLQWVLDAYALTLAALLLTAGSLADLIGRRAVFAAGLLSFTVGSLLCGVATDALFLILARAFQGIGGAIVFATSLALLAQAFRGRDRGVAFGAFGAVTGLAIAVGPVLGGVITTNLSWRWIFFINVPLGVIAVAGTLLRIDESRNPKATRPDLVGFALFSAGLAGLVYGLIESGSDGWGAWNVVATLAAAGVLLVTFVVVELRRREPMLDLSLLRKPTFTGGLIAAFAVNASIVAMFTYIVIYMQDGLGMSAEATGVRFLLLTGGTFVTAAVAGRLTSVVPTRWLIAPGFLLVGIGIVLMHGVTVTSAWTHLIPGFIVCGVGMGLVNTPLASTAVGVVEPARAGMASGINSTARQVGTATGIAVLGSVFASTLRHTVVAKLSATSLAPAASHIAAAVSSGGAPPVGDRASLAQVLVHQAAVAGLVDGLNVVLVAGAAVSFVAAVACAFLIRQKDFVGAGAMAAAGAEGAGGHGAAATSGEALGGTELLPGIA